MGILRFLIKNPLVLLLTIVLAYAGVVTAQYRAERKSRLAAEFHGDSIAAVLDTTRLVHAAGIRAFQRRVLQVTIERDSVDKALKIESVARLALDVRVRELETTDTSTVTVDDADVRPPQVERYVEPYSFNLGVAVPPPPAPALWRIGIRLDPIVLRPRIGCGEPIAGQLVRPATLTVEAPDWADISLTELRQSTEVCNPSPGGPGAVQSAVFTTTGGAFAGGAAVALTGGDLRDAAVGAGIGVGVAWLIKVIF